MGAFAQWLADLGRKIAIYSPVLVLLLGFWLVWKTYQTTVWAVLHIPIPFSETFTGIFTEFAEYISFNEGIAPWLLQIFAVDYLVGYVYALLSHLQSFVVALASLFSGTISVMVVAYTYGRAKALSSVLAGEKLL